MKDFLYRGEDRMQRFLAVLVKTESELRESLKQKAPLQMTEQDWRDFKSAASCHICKKDLVKHNHLDATDVFCPNTGEYLGRAHRFKKAPDSRSSCFFEVYNEIKPDDGKRAKRQPKPDDADEAGDVGDVGDVNADDGICIHCNEPLVRPQFRPLPHHWQVPRRGPQHMQQELLPHRPKENNNPSCLSQPKKLRRPPFNVAHSRG